MGTKVDMSLEDIIKTNKIKPGNRRGGAGGGGRGAGGGTRGRGRGMRRGGVGRGAGRQTGGQGQRQMGGNRQNFGQRGNVNARWNHDMYQGSGGGGGGGGARTQMVMGTSKLLISNLDFGVSDSDIHELFAEFGTTRNAAVHYDRSGRSLGTAHVVFERHHDALKAIKQYNGVHLDGRPMNITLEGGNRGQQQSIAPVKRLSQGPRPFGGGYGGGGRGGRGGMRGNTRGNRGTGTGTRGNTRGTRGTRGAGGRGRGRGGQTKPPTAEELDAELDAYVNQVNK